MINRLPVHNTLAAATKELGSNLYLYHILEETPNGVMVVSLDHRVIYANPSAGRFLEVDFTELTDGSLERILNTKNRHLFNLITDFFQSEKKTDSSRFRKEIDIEKEDKALRILDAVFVYPPSDPDYYILYLIDITHLKILEDELRRRNVFFHNLIDSSVDGIIAADMQGNLILFNQGAQSLLGYTEEEALGNFHVTKLYNDGVAYEVIQRMRSDDFGGIGKLRHQELRVKHKDGHDIPVSFSGGIIYDKGQEIATYGIFTDLRAMQKIEEDLEQTHQMLMQSEKMAGLGRLAAGVAHEINNPMSGIMLYANMVLEDLGDNHPLEEDLKTIIREAERCKVIVADLLEFSHQTSYEMDLIDLNEVAQKTLGVLKNQPLFHNIKVVLNLEEHLGLIFGNTIRLNQVMMNIIVNAAQTMEGNGTLTITTRNRANHGICEVLIKDTGPGIDPSQQEKIFDPFFTTKKTGEGTGLGLSVSYAIVKEHKGTIRVAESSDKGTTFALRFPAVPETPTGEDHAEQ